MTQSTKKPLFGRLATRHHVIRGYSGGGLMEVGAALLHDAFYHSQLWADSDFEWRFGRSMLGNTCGYHLKRQIKSLVPYRPLKIAIQFGERNFRGRRPSLSLTCESSANARDDCFLVILPKAEKQAFKSAAILGDYVKYFGLSVDVIDSSIIDQFSDDLPWLCSLRPNSPLNKP